MAVPDSSRPVLKRAVLRAAAFAVVVIAVGVWLGRSASRKPQVATEVGPARPGARAPLTGVPIQWLLDHSAALRLSDRQARELARLEQNRRRLLEPLEAELRQAEAEMSNLVRQGQRGARASVRELDERLQRASEVRQEIRNVERQFRKTAEQLLDPAQRTQASRAAPPPDGKPTAGR